MSMHLPEPGVAPVMLTLRGAARDVLSRWKLVALLTLAGTVLGALATVALGTTPTATTTLLLVHDDADEPSLAMQTDVGLLGTRALAEQVQDALDVDVTQAEVLDRISAEPATTRLLTLRATGATPGDARTLAATAAEQLLDLRAQLLEQESAARTDRFQEQLAETEQAVADLGDEIEAEQGATGQRGSAQLDRLISERGTRQVELNTLERQVQDEAVRLASLTGGSLVVDEAALVPVAAARGAVLGAASGAVLAGALAVGSIVAWSLLSERPRRRAEITQALGIPVVLTVPDLQGRRFRRTPTGRRPLAVRFADEVFDDRFRRWVVLGVGGEQDALLAGEALLRELTARGSAVTGVDLTRSGQLAPMLGVEATDLEQWAPEASDEAPTTVVVRPGTIPELTRSPVGPSPSAVLAAAPGGRTATSPVTVTVAEVRPQVGLEYLSSWADVALVVVRAGGATVEQLESVGQVLSTSPFARVMAVLVDGDPTDHSLGSLPAPKHPETLGEASAPVGRSLRGAAEPGVTQLDVP